MQTIGTLLFMREKEIIEHNRINEAQRIQELIESINLLKTYRTQFINFIKEMQQVRSLTVYQMSKDQDILKARKMVISINKQIKDMEIL